MQELLARLLLLLQYPQDAKLASRVLIVRENIPQKILYIRHSHASMYVGVGSATNLQIHIAKHVKLSI
jgi:hypothetical protein